MWKDAVLIRSYHRRMLLQEPLVMDKCRRWAARLRHSYWEGKKDQRKHALLIWDLKSITGTCREEKKHLKLLASIAVVPVRDFHSVEGTKDI
jgi:hypothetical protein